MKNFISLILLLFLVLLLLPRLSPGADVKTSDYTISSKRLPHLHWGARFYDADYDGKKELIAVSDNEVLIYEYTPPALKEVKKISGGALDRYVRLDVDGGGLYVTNFRSGRLASFGLKKGSDSNLTEAFDNSPWYLRTLNWNGSDILSGQHVTGEDAFSGGIMKLEAGDGKIYCSERLRLPKKSNIYGPLEMPSIEEGVRLLANLATNRHLYLWRLENDKWKKIGRSAGRYGDSANCVKYRLRDLMDEAKSEYVCVPSPPVLYKFKDGRTIVLVSDHKMYLSEVFGQFPLPREGRIVGLIWDETLGWREVWQTSFIPGYIADYFVDSDPADGKSKLFLIVQIKDAGIAGTFSRGESVLLVYDIDS